MGSCHSVIRGSKQYEIEYKHGKIWNTLAPRDDHLSITSVFRFCLFMGVSCKNMPNDEEQNPVAVRLPKKCLFLLKQLKNWIANNFSEFNAAKINSPIYKEPIYRSPGAGQQMVNTRYRIVLQIKKQDALYQGANRFQMLPWDAHEPPPKRVTRDGGWYIVSLKVLKDEMDFGGQCPDNPDVHLKVILHVANHMTWTPPVVNPCFLKYHVHKTLSSEESCQLFRIQKYLLPNEQPKYPIPKDTRTLIPGLLEFNHGVIHFDCWTPNISTNLNTVLHTSYYKSEDTTTLVSGEPKFNYDAIHLDNQNLNISGNPHTVLHSYYKSGLNFPNPVPSTTIPNPHWFNYEEIHEDHQDVNVGDSKKCPLSTNNKAGNIAAPVFIAVCVLLLLTSPAAADPVSQGHQVEITIHQNSDDLKCTLKIDNEYFLCYGDCNQNIIHHQHIIDDTVKILMGNVCKQNEKAMKMNQISLGKKYSLSSGNLQQILLWEHFNNTMNETIQYLFNYKKLTDEEMTDLPMTFPDFLNSDPNSTVYMERMKYYFKELWDSRRENIPLFPKIDDQPENMNSSVNAKANTTKSWIIAIAVAAVFFIGVIIGVIAIVWIMKCSGKETCKKLRETFSKVTYRRAAKKEAEAEGDPNVMEALKREDHVTDSV